MEAVLELDKKYIDKPNIKRLEIEYGNMNYIIVNMEAKVIDVDGCLWEYTIDKEKKELLNKLIWAFTELDEYDYWPDKSKEHAALSLLWRFSFYDEFDNYYHKSGTTSTPNILNQCVDILKNLK